MNYTEKNLLEDEKILIQEIPSKFIMAKTLFGGFFFSLAVGIIVFFALITATASKPIDIPLGRIIIKSAIVFLLLFILFFIYGYLIYKYNEMVITNKRIITKSGWISINSYETTFENYEVVGIYQGVFGRIFRFGHIVFIASSKIGTSTIVWRFVKNPISIKNKIYKDVLTLNNKNSQQ